MKYISYFSKFFFILFISLIYVNSIFAADAFEYEPLSNSTKDSLIIKKNNSDKFVVLRPGQTVKIWFSGNNPVKGIIKSIQNDTLIFSTEKVNYRLNKDHIKKIQVIKEKKHKFWGWVLTVLGILYFCFSFFGMIGLIAMGGFEIGGFLILLLLISPGYFIYLLGNNIKSPKYNLMKKWKFQ